MRILVNVTSSLMDDYNRIIHLVNTRIDRQQPYEVVLMSDDNMQSICLDDYALFVNLFDDDEDIIDRYHMIYDYALAHGRLNDVLSYYKARVCYDHKAVYYIKKDVSHERRHRLVDYENIYDVIFDIAIYLRVYAGADIGVRSGMLRYRNYDIMDMGELSWLRRNPLLTEYYENIESARHDEQERASAHIVDSRQNLVEIEDIHSFMDNAYREYDDYLMHYISLYSEIMRAFENKDIDMLDYIYVKEYFRIGHLTSIVSCFNRHHYIDALKSGSMSFQGAVNVLELITFALAFCDDNVFVHEIFKKVLTLGKNIEQANGIDAFFFYHEHDFLEKLDADDNDYNAMLSYVDLIESGRLSVNAYNLYNAYNRLSTHYRDIEDIDRAIDEGTHAYEVAPNAIERLKVARMLYDLYVEIDDVAHAETYMDIIKKGVDIMDIGYHNDYLELSCVVPVTRENSEWHRVVMEKVNSLQHIDTLMCYTFAVERLGDFDNGMENSVRQNMLRELIDKMKHDFYIEPIDMYVNIYNALIVQGITYERQGDIERATDIYRQAYLYITTVDEVLDVDEVLCFVEYRLADINAELESAKSYRQLLKSERRLFEYIMRSQVYVRYYKDVCITIMERHCTDKKTRSAMNMARYGMSRIDDICENHTAYLGDAYAYAKYMLDRAVEYDMQKYIDIFRRKVAEYHARCVDNGVNID